MDVVTAPAPASVYQRSPAVITQQPVAAPQQQQPKFKCIRKVGQGAYATVYQAVDASGSEVAVKVVKEARHHSAAVYEYNLTKDLSHPNIVKSIACFKTQGDSVMLVQEYAACGDLFTRIKPGCTADADEVRSMFLQILSGVEYLHSNNLVHRDLKPENAVIAADGTIKICDFGMAEAHGAVIRHGSGTAPYMAPEIIHAHAGFAAHKAHDIWALGVVLYVLLTGDFPWMKANSASDKDFQSFLKGTLMTRGPWAKLSPQMRELFGLMFAPIDKRCGLETLRKYASSAPLYARDTICDEALNLSASTLPMVDSSESSGRSSGITMEAGLSSY